MKTKRSSVSTPRYHLKFYLDHKMVNSLSTKKSKRILLRIRGFGTKFAWDKATLRFNYAPGYSNEGISYTYTELEYCYRCFMEIVPEFA